MISEIFMNNVQWANGHVCYEIRVIIRNPFIAFFCNFHRTLSSFAKSGYLHRFIYSYHFIIVIGIEKYVVNIALASRSSYNCSSPFTIQSIVSEITKNISSITRCMIIGFVTDS